MQQAVERLCNLLLFRNMHLTHISTANLLLTTITTLSQRMTELKNSYCEDYE